MQGEDHLGGGCTKKESPKIIREQEIPITTTFGGPFGRIGGPGNREHSIKTFKREEEKKRKETVWNEKQSSSAKRVYPSYRQVLNRSAESQGREKSKKIAVPWEKGGRKLEGNGYLCMRGKKRRLSDPFTSRKKEGHREDQYLGCTAFKPKSFVRTGSC